MCTSNTAKAFNKALEISRIHFFLSLILDNLISQSTGVFIDLHSTMLNYLFCIAFLRNKNVLTSFLHFYLKIPINRRSFISNSLVILLLNSSNILGLLLMRIKSSTYKHTIDISPTLFTLA